VVCERGHEPGAQTERTGAIGPAEVAWPLSPFRGRLQMRKRRAKFATESRKKDKRP
jgi:hypothetical protein